MASLFLYQEYKMSYKIKSGDTLSALAKKNNTTIAKILAANKGIKNANSIKAGQSITIAPIVGL